MKTRRRENNEWKIERKHSLEFVFLVLSNKGRYIKSTRSQSRRGKRNEKLVTISNNQ